MTARMPTILIGSLYDFLPLVDADSNRYDKIKLNGYDELPEHYEDNTELFEQIAEGERLISFYQEQIDGKQIELGNLQDDLDQMEADNKLFMHDSRIDCIREVRTALDSIRAYTFGSCEAESFSEVYEAIKRQQDGLKAKIDAVLKYIDAEAKPDSEDIAGSMFSIIAEQKMMIHMPDLSHQELYSGFLDKIVGRLKPAV